ncbi:hypothetical protein IAQ61_011483 [Plenodomus lingam]|uniref:uncharacterized protein n=1 Tax=Leptosphaeria maculans TaxID=5022 RepID=UPI00331E3AE8|nr:hypothetical protein IAQ61_011483 [Plenodomus lingam]
MYLSAFLFTPRSPAISGSLIKPPPGSHLDAVYHELTSATSSEQPNQLAHESQSHDAALLPWGLATPIDV